jgi:hypothetical protein
MRMHALFISRLRCLSRRLARALLVVGLILFSCAGASAESYQVPIARGPLVRPRSYILQRSNLTGNFGIPDPGIRDAWYVGSEGEIGSSFGLAFVFELPVLGAGETIDGAAFRFFTSAMPTTPPFNVDLYAIGTNSSGEPLVEFLDSDVPDAGNLRLQDNILTPLDGSNSGVVRTTNQVGGSQLAAYLNGFYTDNPGYAGGSFVHLRLNPDTSDPGLWGRIYLFANGSVSDPQEPVLSFTTVPEPSSYALAAIGVIGLLAFRRRKGVAN